MHSINVAIISYRIAKALGIKHKGTIIAAALLHDIGKLKLDGKILNKKGKLTDAEYEYIKKHVEYGIDILKKLKFPDKICTIVGQHHECNEGNGYPNRLKKDDIYIESQIIKVADSFDALTTNRIYRKKCSTIQALDIMQTEKDKYEKNILITLILVL